MNALLVSRMVLRLALAVTLVTGCTKVSDGSAPSSTQTSGTAGPSAAPRANHATIAHTLRIGDIQDITSLNPHLEAAASLGYLSELTMAYLVRYGPDNRPVPELATVVPSKRNHLISNDGLTITWHLRRGVKWSDGAPFDADDLVFSTNVVNNPQNNEIGRDGWDRIVKIDEPDKFTVVYHLKAPYSAFLPTFFGTAAANPCILPKHLLAKSATINHVDYNNKPVGIGPFRYVRWLRGDRVELEANPNYWRGEPKLKKIVYKFIPNYNTLLTQLQTGEIDLWPTVGLGFYTRVKALPAVTTIHNPGFYFAHLDFNGTRQIFREKAVREALRYAIDRRTIRDKIQHGLGVLQETVLTPVSPFHADVPLVPFDLGKANALLDAAGWKRGTDGVRSKNGQRLAFSFALSTGQNDVDQEVELIRATWQQIGAQISVEHYAPTLMFAPFQSGGIVLSGKFDVISFAWGASPDGSLANLYSCTQMPPNGQNVLHYCNPKMEALLKAETAAYDETARKPILVATQRLLVDDIPQIVMWIREDIYSYNSDLKGWRPNGVSPFDDMLNVDI